MAEGSDLDKLLLVDNSFLVDTQDFPDASARDNLDSLLFESSIDKAVNAPDAGAQELLFNNANLTGLVGPAHVSDPACSSLKEVNPDEPKRRVIRQPHNYAKGFERLINFVKDNYSKEGSDRICQALSCFRPSLIATGMTMGEEDLLTVERNFQRLIHDLHPMISSSGLAIAVWRRTGELVLVNRGFLLLTQYSIKSLLGTLGACKGKPNMSVVNDTDGVGNAGASVIEVESEQGKQQPKSHQSGSMNVCELFSEETCIDYFEKFAHMVLDHDRSTVIIPQAQILTFNKVRVAVTVNLSLKRDIFELPMCVIGSFLVNLDDC